MRQLLLAVLISPLALFARPADELLPGIIGIPEVDFAIPDDFEVERVRTELKSGWSGQVWAAASMMEELLDGQPIPDSYFHADASASMAQTGPTSFAGEDQLMEEAEENGIENVVITKLQWGEYPVLVATGEFDQRPFGMMWIGMNYATNVLRIYYQYSSDKENWPSERKRWDAFVAQSGPLTTAIRRQPPLSEDSHPVE